MRSKWYEYFIGLCKDANGLVNSEKVNKIKKILLIWGGLGVAIGALLFIGGFIGFAASAMSFSEPFIFFILAFIGIVLIAPHSVLFSVGLHLTVGGWGVKMMDKSPKCPHCGNIIGDDEMYCNKCGKPLLITKVCPNCKTENDMTSSYCKSCGKKLDDTNK